MSAGAPSLGPGKASGPPLACADSVEDGTRSLFYSLKNTFWQTSVCETKS